MPFEQPIVGIPGTATSGAGETLKKKLRDAASGPGHVSPAFWVA